MILNCHVQEVDKNGLAAVEVEISSVKATMKSLTVSCSYDSEITAPDKPAGNENQANRQKRFENSFKGLKGKKYFAQVDVQGKVHKLYSL